MKKFFPLLTGVFIILLSSCYSLEQIPIDYMVSADISFPSQIKRVGIVNNVNINYPDNAISPSDSLKSPLELARKTIYSNGDPTAAAESLAEAIAEQNYFDAVIICDSALRAGDIHPRESTLSMDEVKSLTDKLNADVLISLENLQIKTTRIISVMAGESLFWGTVDAQVTPTIRVYLPNRNGALVTVQPTDSIFWEDMHFSDVRLKTNLIPEEQVLKEASEFAGSIPVKYMIPYWTSANRFIYTYGSAEMRDAAVLVKENKWDKAAELWEAVYAKKNEKKKMHAAFNMALYYELKDDFDQAEEWINKAIELAKVKKKNESIVVNSDLYDVSNEVLYAFYAEELKKRKLNTPKLNMQMERFKDEF